VKLIELQAPAEDPELDSATSTELSAAAVAMPPLMIHPHSSFRSAWDIFTLFLLLYCVFSIPFQMSFSSDVPKYYIVPGTEDDSESVSAGVDVVDYIDLFVDAAFMVDVAINLRTAFLRPHATRSLVLETRGHVVAMRYFKTSFVPDVVSSLPYQWITPIINEIAGFSKGTISLHSTRFRFYSHLFAVPRLFKLIRLLRLIKFMRLNRVTRTASNFKSSVGMSHAVFRGISFIVVFFLTVHIIACCLYDALELSPTTCVTRDQLLRRNIVLQGLPRVTAPLHLAPCTIHHLTLFRTPAAECSKVGLLAHSYLTASTLDSWMLLPAPGTCTLFTGRLLL
jgi:hypothetical protein